MRALPGGLLAALLVLALPGCRVEKPPLEERRPLQRFRPQDLYAEIDARRLDYSLNEVEKPGEPPDGPSVVLIVLDTVRADRLAAWGGDPWVTPNLNDFAARATVFTEMVSSATWTLPSHASLFTGLLPIEHGARGSPASADARAYALSEEPPTLAERLAGAGWLTVGLAANRAFLDRTWGLDRGFDVWLCDELPARDNLIYPQADRMSLLAAAALEREAGGERPLFLFLNYMDAHSPWIPRENFTRHPERIDPQLLPRGGQWQARSRWYASRRAVLSRKRAPLPEELATWSEAYDAEVHFLDAQLATLFQALEDNGIGEDDYVVILSDHGEFLGEHALLEHSKDVFEEVIRVPLMIRGPGFTPGVDPRPLQTHQVADLLLEAMAMEPLGSGAQPPGLQISELYWARHRELRMPEIGDRFDRVRRAFIAGDHKLVLSEDGDHAAYDLSADPDEQRSVFGAAPWVAPMRAAAEQWLGAREAAEGRNVELTASQEAHLKQLGYLD